MLTQLLTQFVARLDARLEDDEAADRLTGDLVFAAHDGSFSDAPVVDERTLDFGRGEAVTRNIHDVVDAAHGPVVTFLVAAGAVAGEVLSRELAPVGGLVTLWIPVDAAKHRWPGLLEDEVASLTLRHRVALVVDHVGKDAGDRFGRGP